MTDVQTGPGRRVLHRVESPVDGVVTVRVDWQRRFDHMQQHTAQHLLTAHIEASKAEVRKVTLHMLQQARQRALQATDSIPSAPDTLAPSDTH